MLQGGVVPKPAIAAQDAPLIVRLLGKFVLEVLPAALASVIGGIPALIHCVLRQEEIADHSVLFPHQPYHFG